MRRMRLLAGIIFLACLTGCGGGTAQETKPDKAAETNAAVETDISVDMDELAERGKGIKGYTLVPDGNLPAETEYLLPVLTLDWEEGIFHFSYDVLSSYLATGTFSENDGQLELLTEDGKYHYTFVVENEDTLCFVKDASSDVSLIDKGIGVEIADGARFSASARLSGSAHSEAAAGQAETDQAAEQTAAGEAEPAEIKIEKSADHEAPAGMTVYSILPFSQKGKEWELRVYAQADMVSGGQLSLDDRCHFQIQAVCGQDVWVMFDDTVQLGVPAADVWTDADEALHIVIRDTRSARYRITDYVYEESREQFMGRQLMDADGINYWGQTGKDS